MFEKQMEDIASKKEIDEMLIPNKSGIDNIFGEGGENIREIKRLSGAKLRIDQWKLTVEILGINSDSLSKAKELINKVVSDPNSLLEMKNFPSYKNSKVQLIETWSLLGICKNGSNEILKEGESYSREVIFDDQNIKKTQVLGNIIGKRKEIIEKIQSSSGAAVQTNISLAFEISGTNSESVSKAKHLVDKIISIRKSEKINTFKKVLQEILSLDETPDKKSDDNGLNEEMFEVVNIPTHLANVIVQERNGKLILEKFRELSGVEIKIKKSCTIEIVGNNSESVLKAKEIILNPINHEELIISKRTKRLRLKRAKKAMAEN